MDSIRWLQRLISFNTISSQSNLLLIEAIDDWFKQHGVCTQIIYGRDQAKANLLATFPDKKGRIEGGLILSGHTDVVDVAGQIWDTDPFIATIKNDLIIGRGACDMKGFLAVLLALVPKLKQIKLAKPLHLAFTFDEEVGCLGVHYLLDYMKKKGIRPEGCIVGEPSQMRPIIGEKARRCYHVQIQGLSTHSSLAHQGCNAIEYACRLVSYINKLAQSIQDNGPFDYEFDLPYSTLTTNLISGGIASNVIPGQCSFILESRYLPDFSLEKLIYQIEHYANSQLLPKMKKIYPKAAIYIDKTSDTTGFYAHENALITKIVRTVTGIEERLKVSYSTEAGIFQSAQIPSIICGPGDIKQAHSPNEWISISQLQLCEKVLTNSVTFFCTL